MATSIGLGVAGFFPITGTIASAVSILKDSPALVCNVGHTYLSIKAINSQQLYFENRKLALQRKIENSKISDKATMLDAVDIFTTAVSEKLTI